MKNNNKNLLTMALAGVGLYLIFKPKTTNIVPVQPISPIVPVQPGRPIVPVQPSQPIVPVQPSQPIVPVQPSPVYIPPINPAPPVSIWDVPIIDNPYIEGVVLPDIQFRPNEKPTEPLIPVFDILPPVISNKPIPILPPSLFELLDIPPVVPIPYKGKIEALPFISQPEPIKVVYIPEPIINIPDFSRPIVDIININPIPSFNFNLFDISRPLPEVPPIPPPFNLFDISRPLPEVPPIPPPVYGGGGSSQEVYVNYGPQIQSQIKPGANRFSSAFIPQE